MRRGKRSVQVIDRVLQHGSRSIPYRLHLRRRQGLRIAVTPRLVVNVFAPFSAPKAWTEEALQKKAPWIIKTLDRIAACEILAFPECYSEGVELPYLGRKYRLTLAPGEDQRPYVLLDSLVVTHPDPTDERAVGRRVYTWYREQAAEAFQQSMRRVLPSAAAHGIVEPEVKIRNMRSRWGSCSSGGRVTLNLKLTMLPEALIDYVVMHELCHLVHHDHSKRYYEILSVCMPDWRSRKKRLSRYRMI